MENNFIRNIRELRSINLNKEEIREFFENIDDENVDFTVGNSRVIKEDSVLDVLEEELANDLYLLGSFAPFFLEGVTGISRSIIDVAQNAGLQAQIGAYIVGEGLTNEVAKKYLEICGPGHYFNRYDGGYEEVALYNDLDTEYKTWYVVFKNSEK